MEYEISDQKAPTPSEWITPIVYYFHNKRRQLQDWEANPPRMVGWVLLALVSLELVVARRLFHKIGFSLDVIGDVIGTAVFILLIQGGILWTNHEISGYLNKKGNWKTTLTFFNVGLIPLLAFLPVTVLVWVLDANPLLRLLVFLFLLLKVVSNWRESMEITHELNRFQSALIIYASLGLAAVMVSFLFYVSILSSFVDLADVFH